LSASIAAATSALIPEPMTTWLAAAMGQPLGTSASARMGEPVPLLILSGAAIRIAPRGGSRSRLASDASP
jgi:hypothetical protein